MGIIDIGSNSVRLVVYSGATRIPSIIFNEKVMAGLGKDMNDDGMLSDAAQERALAALRRYRILTRQMGVRKVRVVATAAVRDATNCRLFLKQVRAAGFEAEILSGEEEGILAGLGVLSAIPDADGIVGDLGGGSLELVDVKGGEVVDSISLPFGVLRIAPILEKSEAALVRKLSKGLEFLDFRKRARKRPFYMVGGSWRALARLDMLLKDYPLPITQQYRMAPGRPAALQKALDTFDRADLRKLPSFSASRMPSLPHANLLLKTLVEQMRPSELVVSSFGIREGLLYEDLDDRERERDPLIEAARMSARELGRFAEHGALLDRWIAPVFDDCPQHARLRLAACLLGDVAWQAHPDFRAERGAEFALHGNWVAIDGPGRVMVAQALFSNFGGGRDFADYDVALLCSEAELARAAQWGLAMRLGQRLSGGVAASLENSRLCVAGKVLRLELRAGEGALYGEAVDRRLKTLAAALGCTAETVMV